jgi:hypothetical protein
MGGEIYGQADAVKGNYLTAGGFEPNPEQGVGLTRHDSFKGAWRLIPVRNTFCSLRF